MPALRALVRPLPGLALVAGLAFVSSLLSSLTWLAPFGPLVIALLVGLAFRAAFGLPAGFGAGAGFAARTLLRLGIVLLGVRLDFALLASVGPTVLLGSVLVVSLGIAGVALIGRLLRLPPGLGLGIAVGTAVCGASAVLAAASATRMKPEEAGVSVAVISLVGTLGVVAFTVVATLLAPDPRFYGVLVGLTLQEVAQVLAAGYVPGDLAGDLATIVKLARVALLAPALLVLTALLRPAGGAVTAGVRWPVPPFLLGFLALGVVNSLGWLTPAAAELLDDGSVLLTTMAMVGLGLGLDLAALRRVAGRGLLAGTLGFAGLVALGFSYLRWIGV